MSSRGVCVCVCVCVEGGLFAPCRKPTSTLKSLPNLACVLADV